MSDPTIEILDITPEMAAQWLVRNKKNRRIRPSVVNAYTRDIESGEWPVNGETFKFDWNGDLLDGQHRLQAIVQSGKTMRSIVVTGLPPDARDTVDTGITRTASDTATLKGIPHSVIQTAAARAALILASGDTNLNRKVSTTEILHFILAHPELEEAARRASEVRKEVPGCRPSLLAYAYFMMAQVDSEDTHDFWDAAANLFPAYVGDPAVALAKRFNELALKRQQLSDLETLGLIYRAWNKRRRGDVAKMIKILPVRTPAELPELK
jgi:hypothetical protein